MWQGKAGVPGAGDGTLSAGALTPVPRSPATRRTYFPPCSSPTLPVVIGKQLSYEGIQGKDINTSLSYIRCSSAACLQQRLLRTLGHHFCWRHAHNSALSCSSATWVTSTAPNVTTANRSASVRVGVALWPTCMAPCGQSTVSQLLWLHPCARPDSPSLRTYARAAPCRTSTAQSITCSYCRASIPYVYGASSKYRCSTTACPLTPRPSGTEPTGV